MAQSTARGKGGIRTGSRDTVQLKIAQLTEISDSDRGHNSGDRENNYNQYRKFNKELGTRPNSPRAVGNTRTGSCASTEELSRGWSSSGSGNHDNASANNQDRPAIESYGEPSLALSNKQHNVLEHGKDTEHAWNIIGVNSRQTQAAGGGSKYSNRILAGDLTRRGNKDISYAGHGDSSLETTTQPSSHGTATVSVASSGVQRREIRSNSTSVERTASFRGGQLPVNIHPGRKAFVQHEPSPYNQGNVHSKINTTPPQTSPKSPDSGTTLTYPESGVTSPSPTKQIFKPLAVKRLTKTTKKCLTSFDDIQSPVSSPYSSRRSSISSVGTIDQSEGSSVAENRARLVSAFVLSTQNTAASRYRDLSCVQTFNQSSPTRVDNVRHSMARNQDSPTSDPTSPQLSESGGTKFSLRRDFNSLKIGSVENLRSQSRPITPKRTPPDKGIASTSAPTSPVRTLQKLTFRMRNRRQEFTDIPPADLTRPMSPMSEPGEDEGCVRDFEWPGTQSLPRPRRKNKMVIPELPEVLLAVNKEIRDRMQPSPSPIDKFNLKAPLKHLNIKKQAETTPVSSPIMDTMMEEEMDEPPIPSTRKKERRKKFSGLGQSLSECGAGNNGDNGRSHSDPTQDRKRGSLSEEIEKNSVDSQFFEALQIQVGQIPASSALGANVVSTESSQSISSTATSISDATAEQQFIHVLREVAHHPDGLINSSNLDSQERNGKLKSKAKSRTWPNGDKSQNELDQYTQGIQISSSNPTVSDRQDDLDELQGEDGLLALHAKSESLLVSGGKERVNLQLSLESPHSPQIQRKWTLGNGGSGNEESPGAELKQKCLRQGCDSERLIQSDKHMRSTSEPTTTLSPADDSAVPSLRKPVVTITRSQSMGPDQHHPQERKFPIRKKAIIPPPQPGHSLRPVMQAHMSESTPNLAVEQHKSKLTDALVSPTIVKSNRILGAKSGSSTLPRSAKDKSGELSPTTRRKRKQQVNPSSSVIHSVLILICLFCFVNVGH